MGERSEALLVGLLDRFVCESMCSCSEILAEIFDLSTWNLVGRHLKSPRYRGVFFGEFSPLRPSFPGNYS